MYNFEELDEVTRRYMLEEFLNEEKLGNPYRSTRLSQLGLEIFPEEMEKAIKGGNEETLALALKKPEYWSSALSGIIKPKDAPEALAYTEFNTWYVRGFTRRLMEEGEEYCQVYRAAPARDPRGECLVHENEIYKVKDIYEGHRARYWPKPGRKNVLCIPVGTNCHHSIKRVDRKS